MKKSIPRPGRPRLHISSFQRRIEDRLAEIQEELGPDRSKDYVMINMETDEYVAAKTPEETIAAFEAQWPKGGSFGCRVDGGPFTRMYGGLGR